MHKGILKTLKNVVTEDGGDPTPEEARPFGLATTSTERAFSLGPQLLLIPVSKPGLKGPQG
jgi:hypothetical protein